MRIGLIDVDGHNFPNLALMKLSAYHRQNGDVVDWYQPLISGHVDRVYMSKVFSFTPEYNWCVDADEILQGGTGYCITTADGVERFDASKDKQLPREIENIYPDYGLYNIKDTAYGFLTRGCPRGCGFCHVQAKEGARARRVASLSQFYKKQKKIVLLDPNFIACKDRGDLFEELIDTGATVEFNQGLDIRLLTDADVEHMRRLKMDKIHFAYDRAQDKDTVEPRLEAFVKSTGYNKDKGRVTVFILCNYDTTVEQDIQRIQFCRRLNVSPFPMIYDKAHAPRVYRQLQRWCNNNIFWKCQTFTEYCAR